MNEKQTIFTPMFIRVCLVNFLLMIAQQMANTLPLSFDYQ